MHKDFYAGGFIFHPNSERILLQQYTSDSQTKSPWLLLGENCLEQDIPEEVFTNLVHNLLDIKVTNVLPIYSYTNDTNEAKVNKHSIVYSEITKLQDFPAKNGLQFAWFSFKDILKLQTTPQMKHDIVVGQRVIEAANRKRDGEHTFQ